MLRMLRIRAVHEEILPTCPTWVRWWADMLETCNYYPGWLPHRIGCRCTQYSPMPPGTL
jgi:hypothetical protein